MTNWAPPELRVLRSRRTLCLNRSVRNVGAAEDAAGADRLVLDLSCRSRDGRFYIVTDRWQTFTRTELSPETLRSLSTYASEFLIHGVDVEGLQQGFSEPLVRLLAEHCPIPCTYAGGIRSMQDLEALYHLGGGNIDATVGSALDLFGGPLPYEEVVRFCNSHPAGK
jgi:phosphoribosylformimino-5-aminoimidazole carboxamide ribotide isomerase